MGQLLLLIGFHMIGLLISPLFWVVVLLIAFQAKRAAKMKQELFRVPKEPVFGKTLQGVFFGLLGGYVGSVLLVLLGVSIDEIGIEYLWMVAIVLTYFLC